MIRATYIFFFKYLYITFCFCEKRQSKDPIAKRHPRLSKMFYYFFYSL